METIPTHLSVGTLTLTPATQQSVDSLVSLLLESGDGLHEYLLDGVDGRSCKSWLTEFVQSTKSPYSYQNWRICQLENEIIAGICLAPCWLLGLSPHAMTLTAEKLALSKSYNCSQDDSYHILALATTEIFRGQKIGSTLLSFALSEAKMQGYHRVSLFSREDNEKNLHFYQRHGFEILYQTDPVEESLISPSYFMTCSV